MSQKVYLNNLNLRIRPHSYKTSKNGKKIESNILTNTSRCACNTTFNTSSNCGLLVVAEQPYLQFWADPSTAGKSEDSSKRLA